MTGNMKHFCNLWFVLLFSVMGVQSCSSDEEEIKGNATLFQKWVLDGYGSEADFRLAEQNEEDPDYFITLSADSTMQGRSLCNIIYGKFECDGQSFRFTSFGGTKMGCQSELENPESSFFNTLPKVSRYSIGKDSRLRLYYTEDRFCQFRCHFR